MSSSDLEGRDDRPQVQSLVVGAMSQRALEGADEAPQFDYHKKQEPLTAQELLSFIFHDLRVTYHIPRVAEQAYRSRHAVNTLSDSQTT